MVARRCASSSPPSSSRIDGFREAGRATRRTRWRLQGPSSSCKENEKAKLRLELTGAHEARGHARQVPQVPHPRASSRACDETKLTLRRLESDKPPPWTDVAAATMRVSKGVRRSACRSSRQTFPRPRRWTPRSSGSSVWSAARQAARGEGRPAPQSRASGPAVELPRRRSWRRSRGARHDRARGGHARGRSTQSGARASARPRPSTRPRATRSRARRTRPRVDASPSSSWRSLGGSSTSARRPRR